jgi:dihydroxyacetone kinase DhaKLM complex PTS-EIIA-like component DhaM
MRKVAILIANDTFPMEPSLATLKFTQNDVNELAAVLEQPEVCGFAVKTFINETSMTVLAGLERLSGELNTEDTLLLYYAGHGVIRKNAKLYLATKNTEQSTLGSSAISAEQALEYMRESRAQKRVLILDCCHSGAIGSGFRGGDVDGSLHGLADSFGSYILTASTAIQLAEEREKDGHGVFTAAILEGLTTGKAARDDKITIPDLHSYAHIRLAASATQRPLMWALRQEGGRPFEIADFGKRRARQEQETADRLLSTAKNKFGALLSGRDLTIQEHDYFLRIISQDEGQLMPHERSFRRRLVSYLEGQIGLTKLLFEEPIQNSPTQRDPPPPQPAAGSIAGSGATPGPPVSPGILGRRPPEQKVPITRSTESRTHTAARKLYSLLKPEFEFSYGSIIIRITISVLMYFVLIAGAWALNGISMFRVTLVISSLTFWEVSGTRITSLILLSFVKTDRYFVRFSIFTAALSCMIQVLFLVLQFRSSAYLLSWLVFTLIPSALGALSARFVQKRVANS